MSKYRNVIAFSALTVLAMGALAQDTPQGAGPDPVTLVSRWLHILGAVTLLGGGIFVRLVLMPSAAVLPAEAHDQLRAGVRSRWSKILGALIAILLLTGFYNYLTKGVVDHKGQALYHALMGTKIILAFVVFFLGSLLAGKTGLAQKLQAKASLWLGVTLAMGIAIVMIAGYLRFVPSIH